MLMVAPVNYELKAATAEIRHLWGGRKYVTNNIIKLST